jgi:hypothetical protein
MEKDYAWRNPNSYQATPLTNKSRLCEYSGTERPVDPREHVNSIPLRQLMYGCEYYREGKLYRKSPDQHLNSLLRYMQAPNPGEEPTCMSPTNDSKGQG